jgi:hypothetical protein
MLLANIEGRYRGGDRILCSNNQTTSKGTDTGDRYNDRTRTANPRTAGLCQEGDHPIQIGEPEEGKARLAGMGSRWHGAAQFVSPTVLADSLGMPLRRCPSDITNIVRFRDRVYVWPFGLCY